MLNKRNMSNNNLFFFDLSIISFYPPIVHITWKNSRPRSQGTGGIQMEIRTTQKHSKTCICKTKATNGKVAWGFKMLTWKGVVNLWTVDFFSKCTRIAIRYLISSISVECKPPACREYGLHKIWRDVNILLWPWCDLHLDVWSWPY